MQQQQQKSANQQPYILFMGYADGLTIFYFHIIRYAWRP